MRILISADIEGVCGVAHPDQTLIGNHGYEQARRLMTQEVNAVAAGALEAGAAHVAVVDGHGQFRNLVLEELHDEVALVAGKPRLHGMLGGLAEHGPWDALFLVGYHARAGSFGVLAHTINGAAFARVDVNGVPVGETFLNSLLAGEHAVPVWLVSGDDCLAAEAGALLPHAEVVAVKKALGNRAAEHLPLKKARAALHEAAKQAVNKATARTGELTFANLPAPPYTVQVTTVRPFHADCFAMVPGVTRDSAVTLSFAADTPTTLMRFLNTFSAMAASL